MKPYFIIGTGRCGSTMLTNLINSHPEILSVSEFFASVTDLGGRIPETFANEQLDGVTFWNKISAIMPRKSLMFREKVDYKETLYPYDSEQSAYSADSGIPAILQVTLPHLTQQHDELFNKLGEVIRQQSVASLREHYDYLFTWLGQEFNRSVWVERSGGSCFCVDQLAELYPDARYIHLTRDGRNTAISMREHRAFRMFMLAQTMTQYLGVDPFESDDRSQIDQLPAALRCFLPESFDREAFMNFRFPFDAMGTLWSQLIALGIGVLDTLPADNVLTLSYERFCEHPKENLKKVIDFMGLNSDPQWLDDAVKDVKINPSSWETLAEPQRKELEAACSEGMQLLDKVL